MTFTAVVPGREARGDFSTEYQWALPRLLFESLFPPGSPWNIKDRLAIARPNEAAGRWNLMIGSILWRSGLSPKWRLQRGLDTARRLKVECFLAAILQYRTCEVDE